MTKPNPELNLHEKRNFTQYLELSRYGRKVLPDWFMPMLDDQARNVFYRQMIQGKVKDKVVVDLGSGTGMWTIEALSQGAKFVYVIERNPLLIEYLKVIFKDSPVKIISMPIEDLSPGDFDSGTPEVIIHELFGVAGLGEGVIPLFQKVWKLFDPKSVQLIPQHTWLEGRVLHSSPLPLSPQEKALLKENEDLLYELIYPFEMSNKVRAGKHLGESTPPSPLIYLDLKSIEEGRDYELETMPVEFRPGMLHTVHVSFRFSAEKEGPFFDTFLENEHHWGDAEIDFYVSKSIAPTTKKLTFKLLENSDLGYPQFQD